MLSLSFMLETASRTNLFTLENLSAPLVMAPGALARWLPHGTTAYVALALHTIRKLLVIYQFLGSFSPPNEEN